MSRVGGVWVRVGGGWEGKGMSHEGGKLSWPIPSPLGVRGECVSPGGGHESLGVEGLRCGVGVEGMSRMAVHPHQPGHGPRDL